MAFPIRDDGTAILPLSLAALIQFMLLISAGVFESRPEQDRKASAGKWLIDKLKPICIFYFCTLNRITL